MSSLSRMLAGRKKESKVWDYYEDCEGSMKSRCIVVNAKTNQPCGVLIAGKNSTNLTAHLRRFHKDQHTELLLKTEVNQKTKKSHAITFQPSTAHSSQTLQDCINRRIPSWPIDSIEHQRRQETLVDFLTETGYPVTMIDRPSFREFVRTLDGKFKLPGS